MHDEIKRFALEGQIKDGNLIEDRDRRVLFVESMMRDEGYVPVLDIEPQFTVDYKEETETYEFELSVYGIYLGEQAWTAAGVMAGKTIMRSTPLRKSRAF